MIDPDSLKRGSQAAALVAQMSVTTVLGGWVGRQLDGRLDTDPWLSVTGFVGGFAVGMTVLFLGMTRLNRADDEPPTDP